MSAIYSGKISFRIAFKEKKDQQRPERVCFDTLLLLSEDVARQKVQNIRPSTSQFHSL